MSETDQTLAEKFFREQIEKDTLRRKQINEAKKRCTCKKIQVIYENGLMATMKTQQVHKGCCCQLYDPEVQLKRIMDIDIELLYFVQNQSGSYCLFTSIVKPKDITSENLWGYLKNSGIEFNTQMVLLWECSDVRYILTDVRIMQLLFNIYAKVYKWDCMIEKYRVCLKIVQAEDYLDMLTNTSKTVMRKRVLEMTPFKIGETKPQGIFQ